MYRALVTSVPVPTASTVREVADALLTFSVHQLSDDMRTVGGLSYPLSAYVLVAHP